MRLILLTAGECGGQKGRVCTGAWSYGLECVPVSTIFSSLLMCLSLAYENMYDSCATKLSFSELQ